MSKIKIDIPEKIHGQVEIPVRITDINYGNHLGNDAVVSILHEARVQWLAKANLSEMNVGGCGLIMSNLIVDYKNQSYYGDKLTIEFFIGKISMAGFDLIYQVKNQENKIIALAQTAIVCFDYDLQKVVPIPNLLLDYLKK